MPTFEIGLEDGRKLRIEADSQEAALAGAQHFMTQSAPDHSVTGAFQRGAADTVRGIGQTVDVLAGAKGTGEGLANTIDNPNYQPQSPTAELAKGNIGAGAAAAAKGGVEMAPGIAAPLAARALAKRFINPRLAIPAMLATAAAEYFGPNVKQRAANMGHEEPTAGDIAMGAGTTAAQTAMAAAPLARLIPGANPITSVGTQGLVDTAKKWGATAATEAAAAAGQSGVSQAGATVGTPGGLKVDPTQMADAALSGGAAGGMFSGPRASADAMDAIKYRNAGGDNAAASSALAARLQSAAPGDLANPKVGKAALDATEGDIKREIKAASDDLLTRKSLTPDAANALVRAAQGGKIAPQELGGLTREIAGDPQAANLEHLIRQARMAQIVRSSGYDTGGKLVGGAAGAVEAGVHAIKKPLQTAAGALIAGLGLGHGIPGFVGMYAPHTVLPLFGAYGAMRLLSSASGSRSPVNRFAQRFADPSAQVRLPVASAPAAPAGPSAGPTGPAVPPGPKPWGVAPPMQPPEATNPFAAQIKDAMDLMAARRANQKLQTSELERDVALHEGMSKIVAGIANTKALEEMRGLREQTKDATDLMAARRANAPAAQEDPLKAQIKDASDLMAARTANKKLADALAKAKGEAIAEREAAASPKITDLGIVSRPGFGQRASALLSAQRALNALRAEPNEEGGAVSPQPNPTKVSKANGKVKVEMPPPMEEAIKATQPAFQPKSGPKELPYFGQEHAEVADHKLANRPDYKELTKGRKEIIREGIIRGRSADEARIMKHAPELTSTEDHATLLHLLEEFHHTSSRQRAREARDYYTSKLPPDVGAKIRAELDDAYINKSKRKD